MKFIAENITAVEEGKFILKNFSHDFSNDGIVGILSTPVSKTNLALRALCGMFRIISGTAKLNDEIVNSETGHHHIKVKSNISYVFRNGGLISNISVNENLLLPLDFHFKNLSQSDKKARIDSYLEKFELESSILDKRPAQLAIHEHKLIILIRSFITHPTLILMDEPTDGLDIKSKKLVIEEILELRKEQKTIQIFTTNSESELIWNSDKLILLEEGELIEYGTFENLLNSQNSFVKKLLTDYSTSLKNET
ncbi:MAG TPA: ATP-binding cassette domain-containing protein [Ignavibacteriaceae bacterium]|nr:ATP-binding cassette domain-containing protein [Ignavibacteriaceae bacterium]